MTDEHKKPNDFSTTTGHEFSEVEWLDRHFEMAKAEYEQMLRAANFQQGWTVLDAGCGSGSFIPLMSTILGSDGKIHAIDLAPENIDYVNHRAVQGVFKCPVDAKVSSVTTLNYPDESFDGVWCGAVAQYLSDDDLQIMLSEFLRVLKPGGLVALKDWDTTLNQWYVPDPTFIWRLLDSARQNHEPINKRLRTLNLRKWFLEAGFKTVTYSTTVIERMPPLKPVEQQFIQEAIQHFVSLGIDNQSLSENDQKICGTLLSDDKLSELMNSPKFYYREGHGMVIAYK